MNAKDWTSDEFMAFMMIYAAYADNFFATEEKDLIIEKVGQKVFEEVHDYYQSLSDMDRIMDIASFRDKYIDTPEKKQMVLDEMEKIFKSDGEFARVEQEVLKSMAAIL